MKLAQGAEAPQVKSYAFKGEMSDQMLKGGPSVMGVLDHGRDVVFPGAYKSVLRHFLQKGFVSDTHEWTWESMLAMPVVAEERGNVLYSEAVFHSTQRAQDARIIAKERLDRGLSVGLSVGYVPDSKNTFIFENGEELINYAEENGYQMDLFDVKGIKGDKRPMRGIAKMKELLEYSITPAPMNTLAEATEAKMLYSYPGYGNIAMKTATLQPTGRNVIMTLPAGMSDAEIAAAVKSAQQMPLATIIQPGLEAAPEQTTEDEGVTTASRKQANEGGEFEVRSEVKAMVETYWGSTPVSAYFDQAEERATVTSLRAMNDCLWNCVYDTLFYNGEEEMTTAARIEVIEEAINMFGVKAIALAKAILSLDLDSEEGKAAKKALGEMAERKTNDAGEDGENNGGNRTEKKHLGAITIDAINGTQTVRQFEDLLRDGGMSQTAAVAMIAKTRQILQGEPGGQNGAEAPQATPTTEPATTAEPKKRVYRF